MRVMLKAELPVEATNPKIKDGSVPGVIASIMERLKPEAAYFGPVNGTRTAVLFLNIEDSSEIPAIVEPWFLAFEADVEVKRTMTRLMCAAWRARRAIPIRCDVCWRSRRSTTA